MARELRLARADGEAVVKITCPSNEVANDLASALVERRVAACVNVIPGITSIYRWQGEICRDPEVLLIVKTTFDQSEALLKVVGELHPYEVPEALWIAVDRGNESYLEWLRQSVAPF